MLLGREKEIFASRPQRTLIGGQLYGGQVFYLERITVQQFMSTPQNGGWPRAAELRAGGSLLPLAC